MCFQLKIYPYFCDTNIVTISELDERMGQKLVFRTVKVGLKDKK